MSRILLILCGIGTSIGLVDAQESCSNPEGRVLEDPADPFGGANNLNGDTEPFDISDMIHGLQFLFVGGAPPCALVQPELTACQKQVTGCQEMLDERDARIAELEGFLDMDLVEEVLRLRDELGATESQLAAARAELEECRQRGLPATGLTMCYSQSGQVIPCESNTCPGQDAAYGGSCSLEDRFDDHGDGTVTDRCTGLMWQKETAPGTYNWCAAVTYCDGLTLAGKDDWRLPNVRELQSIVDYGRILPAVDPVFAPTFREYWSSTSGVNVPHRAWAIDFGDGLVGGDFKTVPYRVRAVRGGS